MLADPLTAAIVVRQPRLGSIQIKTPRPPSSPHSPNIRPTDQQLPGDNKRDGMLQEKTQREQTPHGLGVGTVYCTGVILTSLVKNNNGSIPHVSTSF